MTQLFRMPGQTDRTTIIGATGSGKTTCGVWLLSFMNFHKMPWVVIDFKREQLFDDVGFPPIQPITFKTIPKKRGLYLLQPRPGDEDELEDWIWRAWQSENVGLYIDEAMLMPNGNAFRAVLQQGRSKHLPVIACTQRPVDVKRAVFSEASFFAVYRLLDKRDYKTIEGFVPVDMSNPLPQYMWRWYDVSRNQLLTMKPVPKPEEIVLRLQERIPYSYSPFRLQAHPTRRGRGG